MEKKVIAYQHNYRLIKRLLMRVQVKLYTQYNLLNIDINNLFELVTFIFLDTKNN